VSRRCRLPAVDPADSGGSWSSNEERSYNKDIACGFRIAVGDGKGEDSRGVIELALRPVPDVALPVKLTLEAGLGVMSPSAFRY
jgi:hypothetical protein